MRGANTTNTSYNLSGLDRGEDYTWYIDACNDDKCSESDFYGFQIKGIEVGTPRNINVSINGTSANISWNSVNQATKYKVSIYDQDGNDDRYEYTSDNSIRFDNLHNNHTYKVRVRAYIGDNHGDYSNYYTFKIEKADIPKNIHITPADSCSNAPIMDVNKQYHVNVNTGNYGKGSPIDGHSRGRAKVRGFWLRVRVPDGYYATNITVDGVSSNFNPVIGLKSNCSYGYYPTVHSSNNYADDRGDGGSETFDTGLTGPDDQNDGIYYIRIYHYDGSESPTVSFNIRVK